MLSQWIVRRQTESENSIKCGGANAIIELDESCFFKRKSNKGQALKNKWIFSFIQRGTDKFYAEVAEKRDAKTLIPIIKK